MEHPAAEDKLAVLLITPQEVLFDGSARSVILPGEKGTFEVLPHHKPLLSLIVKGDILVDGRPFPIKRGLAKVAKNSLQAIIEPRLD